MFTRLLSLEWKSFFRSAGFGKGLAIKLFLGFLALYFLSSFFVFGAALHPLLKEAFPQDEPIHMVNKFILVWYCLSFIMRIIFQNLPLLNVKPLLLLDINRGTVVHYSLMKTIYSFWNLLFLVAIIPYTLFTMKLAVFAPLQMMGWFVAVVALEYLINFLALYISKNFNANFKRVLPFILIILLLVALDYFKVFSISDLFGSFLNQVLTLPILAIIPIVLVAIVYRLLFNNIKQNMYLDAYLQQTKTEFKSSDLSWTSRFGELAPYLQLDLKLLWRAKRARNVLVVCVLFLAYGLFFYTNPKLIDSSMISFVGIFLSGIFIINFGQFIPAWDSSYYPLLMSQNITMKQYLESKAILMYLSVGILTMLSTPYLYFGWNIFWTNIAFAVYNLGINVPLILYFGSMNRKRIDLDNASFLNYQGIGAAQWLVGIPLLAIPILIWGVAKMTLGIHMANVVFAMVGIIGFALKNQLLNNISQRYETKKYDMLKGFREVNN
ncbi:MAG: DUF5687 family protein [Sphingobacterium hotanense]